VLLHRLVLRFIALYLYAVVLHVVYIIGPRKDAPVCVRMRADCRATGTTHRFRRYDFRCLPSNGRACSETQSRTSLRLDVLTTQMFAVCCCVALRRRRQRRGPLRRVDLRTS